MNIEQQVQHAYGASGTEPYDAPRLVELEEVAVVTLGKYAEDSADKGRYFE